ncbi:MAG TPA: hypothetical protein VFW62_04135 [bacterium]|nr:hypothetical protein [bacterium]
MVKLSHLTVVLLFAGMSFGPLTAFAQATKPELEDELVDDLLKDLPKSKSEVPATEKPIRPAAIDEAERKLRQDLEGGEDVGAPPENPLTRIGQRMRLVEERIAGKDTSDETQSAQKEILADLAKLIEQTRRQCSGGNNSGKPGSGKSSPQAGAGNGEVRPGPAREATDRVGKPETEKAQTADVKDVLKRFWGHLPEKLRDQMQAQLSEQFLPKYEKLIEEYYKRLAEERGEK